MSDQVRHDEEFKLEPTLPIQFPHGLVQAVQSQAVHAAFHQLVGHLDRRGVVPVAFGHRVQPDRMFVLCNEAFQPDLA